MLLALAVWLGGIIFFSSGAAPAVLHSVSDRSLGGAIISESLTRLHYGPDLRRDFSGSVAGVLTDRPPRLSDFFRQQHSGSAHGGPDPHLAACHHAAAR